MRLCDLREGIHRVCTAGVRGDHDASNVFRTVRRIWASDPLRSNTEMVRFRGVWFTSHHPVLLGADWRYPADLAPACLSGCFYGAGRGEQCV